MAKIETMIKWESETSQQARDKILNCLISLDVSDMRKILLAATMENIYLIGKLDGVKEAGQRSLDAIQKFGKAVQS